MCGCHGYREAVHVLTSTCVCVCVCVCACVCSCRWYSPLVCMRHTDHIRIDQEEKAAQTEGESIRETLPSFTMKHAEQQRKSSAGGFTVCGCNMCVQVNPCWALWTVVLLIHSRLDLKRIQHQSFTAFTREHSSLS